MFRGDKFQDSKSNKPSDIYRSHIIISNSFSFFTENTYDKINAYSLLYSYTFVYQYFFCITHVDVIIKLMVSIYTIYWHMSWYGKNIYIVLMRDTHNHKKINKCCGGGGLSNTD